MKSKPIKSTFSNVFYMLKILWKGSPAFVFFTFFKEITEGVFWTFFSVYMTQYIYVSIENKTPFTVVVAFVGAMSLGHVIIHIISATHQYFSKQLVPEMYRDVYKKVIEKSISMDFTRFEEPDFYDKYTRALGECQSRGMSILLTGADTAGCIVAVVASVWVVARVDPVLLLFILPMVFISLFLGKKSGDLYYQLDFSNTRDGRVGSYAKRVFYEKKYAGELRLFSMGELLLTRHEQAFDDMQKRNKEIRRKVARLETLKWVLFAVLSTTLPYLYITFVLNKDFLNVASYIAMIPALSYLSWCTSAIVELVVDLSKQGAFISNLREFLSYTPPKAQNKKPVKGSLNDIVIRNMGFTYQSAKKPVLHNVNMKIRKGEKIAIVGHNGAGKTTLVKLIMGLYQATEGEIIISGENINSFESKSFHQHFGTVFQDLQIFALPLSHNVLMRKPVNDEERRLVEDSLRKAQFGDKLDSLPKGIDTMVTKEFDEDGMGLSGGEAQKIAIARVFAGKPDIVILDEPSSALDPIAEYNMYQNMLSATNGETVIFISHRLSATRDADRIYMFENGTIIEQGSHRELMELEGKYFEMWELQAQNYLAEEVEV